jgi:hypothetical protein
MGACMLRIHSIYREAAEKFMLNASTIVRRLIINLVHKLKLKREIWFDLNKKKLNNVILIF